MDFGIRISDIFEAIIMLMKNFWWLFLLVLSPTIINLVFKLVKRSTNKGKKKGTKKSPIIDFSRYRLRKSILSKNELDFYHCLKSVIGNEPVILTKVRLADIFYVKGGKGYYKVFNKISAKHIDFLLCDPKDFKPFMAIEVDDRSHEKVDRKKRDKFVNGLFEAMKLPILRYKANKTYLVEDVKDQVSKILSEHYFDEENGKNSTMKT